MGNEQLKEYLKIVIDLEKNVYMQQKYLSSLKQKVAGLAIPKNIPEPQYPKNKATIGLTIGLLSSPFLISLSGYIIGEFAKYLMNTRNVIAALIGSVLLLIGVLFVLSFPLVLIYTIYTIIKVYSEQEEHENEYQIARSSYYLEVQNEKSRMLKESIEKKVIDSQIDLLARKLDKTSDILKKVYEKNLIYPKYRNLPMLCSILEYLDSGRCDTLTGSVGAYNILEYEIRMDYIIVLLNKILMSLEDIKTNQAMLYSELKGVEPQIRSFETSTNKIINSLTSRYIAIQNTDEELLKLGKDSNLAKYCVEYSQIELKNFEWVNNNC